MRFVLVATVILVGCPDESEPVAGSDSGPSDPADMGVDSGPSPLPDRRVPMDLGVDTGTIAHDMGDIGITDTGTVSDMGMPSDMGPDGGLDIGMDLGPDMGPDLGPPDMGPIVLDTGDNCGFSNSVCEDALNFPSISATSFCVATQVTATLLTDPMCIAAGPSSMETNGRPCPAGTAPFRDGFVCYPTCASDADCRVRGYACERSNNTCVWNVPCTNGTCPLTDRGMDVWRCDPVRDRCEREPLP